MNIADISLAIGMGLPQALLIAGHPHYHLFVCVNYPRRTKR